MTEDTTATPETDAVAAVEVTSAEPTPPIDNAFVAPGCEPFANMPLTGTQIAEGWSIDPNGQLIAPPASAAFPTHGSDPTIEGPDKSLGEDRNGLALAAARVALDSPTFNGTIVLNAPSPAATPDPEGVALLGAVVADFNGWTRKILAVGEHSVQAVGTAPSRWEHAIALPLADVGETLHEVEGLLIKSFRDTGEEIRKIYLNVHGMFVKA